MPEDLPTLIRTRREDLGMSRVELAALVGRSPSTVGSWEQGRTRPTPATLETLSGVLGLEGAAGELRDPVAAERPTIEGTMQSNPIDTVEEPVEAIDEPAPVEPASFLLDLTEFEEVVAAAEPDVAPGPDPEPEAALVEEREPGESVPTLDGVKESAEPAEELVMVAPQVTPTTVVVAPTRRRAARAASRVDGPATVGTVQPIRTDADRMYRVRSLITLAALGLMGIVFLWAASEAGDAIRVVLDAFMAPFVG